MHVGIAKELLHLRSSLRHQTSLGNDCHHANLLADSVLQAPLDNRGELSQRTQPDGVDIVRSLHTLEATASMGYPQD